MTDVRTIIIDFGIHTTRAGFAGDDLPVVVVPSHVAIDGQGRFCFGYEALAEHAADIRPVWQLAPVQGRLFRTATEREYVEAFLAYLLNKLGVGSSASAIPLTAPLLIIDPMPAFAVETKQQLAQLAFERHTLPGLYFASHAALSAFAAGKPSALVVDVGASGTSVVGVVDGLVTAHSWQRLGGETVTVACQQLLGRIASDIGIEEDMLKLSAQVASKECVPMGKPPVYSKRSVALSPSYVVFQQHALLEDFKSAVVQVGEPGARANELALKPPRFYEFPCGFNRNFGPERFDIGEVLLAPPDADMVGLTEQIERVHRGTDAHAACNIVVSGGGSLIDGLPERIAAELQARLPRGYGRGALRISWAGTMAERRHAAWLGASVLASIGSFHRVWVAPHEFAESGLAAFDRRPYAAALVNPQQQ